MIEGMITDYIYRNDDNGYSVILVEGDEEYTVTGYFHDIPIGEYVSFEGDFYDHPEYGIQFKAKSYQVIAPKDETSIIAYLSYGIIKGVGAKTAKLIYEAFGDDALDIIYYSPDRLTEIRGIGAEKAKTITESLREQRGNTDSVMFFQGLGLTNLKIQRIIAHCGNGCVEMIKANPYLLCENSLGIGFATADQIALKLGYSKDGEPRIRAMIIDRLKVELARGHCYLPVSDIADYVRGNSSLDIEAVIEIIDDMHFKCEIFFEKEERVFLHYIYEAEYEITKGILFKTIEEGLSYSLNEDQLYQIEALLNITYAKEQREAIELVAKSPIVVITGGPGTGKTTTIRGIISMCELLGLSFDMAAPTGRAAKRIKETTDVEAKTIHRLLEFNASLDMEDGFFDRNSQNPLDCDVLIVDESSMIDVRLMSHLIKAISPKTKLVLVGDVDQLPPVGPGNVLRDIISSDTVPVIHLREIFRQGKESLIVTNAHRINSGEMPIFNDNNRDFFFVRSSNPKSIKGKIIELISERLPNYGGYDPLRDIQILSPIRKGDLGVIALNNALQASLNPPSNYKSEKAYGERVFRTGDKVMQTKNNYSIAWERSLSKDERYGQGVFNGDIGYIEDIDLELGLVAVRYDDKLVHYDNGALEELELSYATTVHKSQGSEFPVVIFVAGYTPPMLASRNLLYTAITRAKKLLVIVGHEGVISNMVSNGEVGLRFSGLRDKLMTVYKEANSMDL